MARRRFELDDEVKFWEVGLDDATMITRFGTIGSPGHTKLKKHSSAEEATASVENAIAEKLKGGYREVAEEVIVSRPGQPKAPPRKGSSPTKKATPALEAQPTPTVLRWTLTKGDWEIVLILIGTKLVTNETMQTFPSTAKAREHAERVLMLRKKEGYVARTEEIDAATFAAEMEALAKQGGDDVISDDTSVKLHEGKWLVTFRGDMGVPVTTCTRTAERIERDQPKCVQLVCDHASPGKSWPTALRGKKLPSVEAFIFDTYFQTQTRQGRNTIGDLSATLEACPSLERMFATGDLVLTACSHVKLKTLHLLGDPLSAGFLRGLGSCELPNLERIVLSLASDAGPGPDTAAIAALKSLRAARLREVILESIEDVTAAITKLAPIAKERCWQLLALRGSVEDEDLLLETLKEHASDLSSLRALALPFTDDLSSEAEESARTVVACVEDIEEHKDASLPAAYKDW